jgi:hypothetical protein
VLALGPTPPKPAPPDVAVAVGAGRQVLGDCVGPVKLGNAVLG